MTRLASDNSVNCPETQAKVWDQCAAACCSADEMHWCETVKERRHSTESLTLFSNDWFNLIVCVDLFTHLTYMLYSISVCRNFPHYKLESCGMSKTKRYTHNPPPILDMIKYNSIIQNFCEIKFHSFSKFSRPGNEALLGTKRSTGYPNWFPYSFRFWLIKCWYQFSFI